MRKHVLKIAALALVLMMIGGAALSEVVTTGSVWLRSAPNLWLLPHASAFSPDYVDLYFEELAPFLASL